MTRAITLIGGLVLTAAFAAEAHPASAPRAAVAAEGHSASAPSAMFAADAGQQPPAKPQAPAPAPATPPGPSQPPSPQGASAAKGQPQAEKPPSSVPQAPAEPQGYTYNPEGRRDPFISLARGGTTQAASMTGPRPPGLPGMAVSDVTLSGTMQSRTGYVGLLKAADGKTYIVRPGDKLLDGTIRTITAEAMVIVQQVNDPLSLEKQREVRKVLRQTDEVK